MRHGIGLFALVFGVIVIAVAARYGFKTSDNETDGYIWAAIYGGVTLAGLCGHMIGVRLWRYGMHKFSLFIFAVSFFVLLISLSNSLGAMAGRMNATVAARLHTAETLRNARDSLKGDEAELKALRELRLDPAEWTEVEAAASKAKAAAEARKLDCAPPADGTAACLRKRKAEDEALKAQAEVSKRKATAERVTKLEASIEANNKIIREAGPELEANSQGNALARLFALPEGDAAKLSTYQNLAMAFGIELLIALALILYEVMTEHEREQMPKPAPSLATATQSSRLIRPEPEATATPIIEAEPEKPVEPAPVMKALATIEEEPKAFPAPPRPRLIASRPDPVGSVPEIFAEIVEAAPRGKVGIIEVFNAYSEACRAHGKRPISANEFPSALADRCERLGIKAEISDKGAYLLKVRLKKSGKNSASA